MTRNRKTAKRSKPRITGILILILSVFIAELLFYTWCRVQCVQVGYAIANENRRQQELKTLQNSLKIELTRLKAPERISRIARKQLGLGLPDPQQTIVVP